MFTPFLSSQEREKASRSILVVALILLVSAFALRHYRPELFPLGKSSHAESSR